jgi:chromosome segregation ATPase
MINVLLDIMSTIVFVQHMQAELAALQAQLSSANTNVDRLTLRLEDSQTALAEKERLNNELQQDKAALKVQVGMRKSPDERGGADVEELHKQCASLESQIKHLESRVTEEQIKASGHEKALQKERKNTEKLQLALEEGSVRTRVVIEWDSPPHAHLTQDKSAKAEEEASLLEQQSRHYKDELDKALRQIKQLKTGVQPVCRIP